LVKDEIQPRIPMTVQEMPEFAKEADRILGDALRIQLLTSSKVALGGSGTGKARRRAGDLLFLQPIRSSACVGYLRIRQGTPERTMKKTKRSVKKPLGERLIDAMRQAVDFAEGKDVPGIRVHIPAAYDVRKIRTLMKLSQKEFAERFGFSIDSVQNWEQGRRIPDGPARTLLAVIAHEPKAVERALQAAG
jgi:putative transcriptional regulator